MKKIIGVACLALVLGAFGCGDSGKSSSTSSASTGEPTNSTGQATISVIALAPIPNNEQGPGDMVVTSVTTAADPYSSGKIVKVVGTIGNVQHQIQVNYSYVFDLYGENDKITQVTHTWGLDIANSVISGVSECITTGCGATAIENQTHIITLDSQILIGPDSVKSIVSGSIFYQ